MALVEEIRHAKNAQPFRPFDLKLVDGTTHRVRHPDFITIPPVPRPREVIFFTPGEDDDYRSHWIQVGLIVELILPSDTEALAREAREMAAKFGLIVHQAER